MSDDAGESSDEEDRRRAASPPVEAPARPVASPTGPARPLEGIPVVLFGLRDSDEKNALKELITRAGGLLRERISRSAAIKTGALLVIDLCGTASGHTAFTQLELAVRYGGRAEIFPLSKEYPRRSRGVAATRLRCPRHLARSSRHDVPLVSVTQFRAIAEGNHRMPTRDDARRRREAAERLQRSGPARSETTRFADGSRRRRGYNVDGSWADGNAPRPRRRRAPAAAKTRSPTETWQPRCRRDSSRVDSAQVAPRDHGVRVRAGLTGERRRRAGRGAVALR